ncbi:hypothetical protein HDU92_000522 [Lobulomyces angularis]|nr:hypothetical protein HDU92_000522 [Lobulomyces angularis]
MSHIIDSFNLLLLNSEKEKDMKGATREYLKLYNVCLRLIQGKKKKIKRLSDGEKLEDINEAFKDLKYSELKIWDDVKRNIKKELDIRKKSGCYLISEWIEVDDLTKYVLEDLTMDGFGTIRAAELEKSLVELKYLTSILFEKSVNKIITNSKNDKIKKKKQELVDSEKIEIKNKKKNETKKQLDRNLKIDNNITKIEKKKIDLLTAEKKSEIKCSDDLNSIVFGSQNSQSFEFYEEDIGDFSDDCFSTCSARSSLLTSNGILSFGSIAQ